MWGWWCQSLLIWKWWCAQLCLSVFLYYTTLLSPKIMINLLHLMMYNLATPFFFNSCQLDSSGKMCFEAGFRRRLGFGFANCDLVDEIVFSTILLLQTVLVTYISRLFVLSFCCCCCCCLATFACGQVCVCLCLRMVLCVCGYFWSQWLNNTAAQNVLNHAVKNVNHKRMASTQITHLGANGKIPELRVCLETLQKHCSAWVWSLNVLVLWPFL